MAPDRTVTVIALKPPCGARTVSAPSRPSEDVAPAGSTTPRAIRARTNDSPDGSARRTRLNFAAPDALRARSVSAGVVRSPRTPRDSEGFAVLGAVGVTGAGATGTATSAGGGAGTHVPTMLTGTLCVAVPPDHDVTVASVTGFEHSGPPTVNSPLDPPSTVSANDDTAVFGRLSSVVTSRLPFSAVVAGRMPATPPLTSVMVSPGSPPAGFSEMKTGPVIGPPTPGALTFTEPTRDPAGHPNRSAWAASGHSVCSALMFANRPSGSVTTAFLIAA